MDDTFFFDTPKIKELLARQLRYERALAGCSQTLLRQPADEQDREAILNHALDALREAARVSRIGLFAMDEDPSVGLTSRMAAEATAPGFPSRLEQLRTPEPAAHWEMFNARMRAGEVIHGRMRDLYASQPEALKDMDVRSVLFCPVHVGDSWWGYLAYGDASEEKVWEEDEERLIRTAARMFAGALQRLQAEAILRRQLRMQRALTRCSQALLAADVNDGTRLDALNTALGHLMDGAGADRAYLFRNFTDPEMGECFGMVAEAVVPDLDHHILNPANLRMPWARLPKEKLLALNANRPFGGPVERLFASTPLLLDAFRKQGLRSVMMVPIRMRGSWWGFLGFDDQKSAREWDDLETMLLRTAAEIIGGAMQRWQLEEELERRVIARTAELAESNRRLSQEIEERRWAEESVRRGLAQEQILAAVSARMLQEQDFGVAVDYTLNRLGHLMQADRSVLFWFRDPDGTEPMVFRWQIPERPALPPDFFRALARSFGWARGELEAGRTVFCDDPSHLPAEAEAERAYLEGRGVKSLLIVPLAVGDRLIGALACSDFPVDRQHPDDKVRVMQVVSGMLGSQLQRQELLESLEERVAARTAEVMAFQDITILAREARPLSDLLQPALQRVREVTACDFMAIHLLAPGEDFLQLSVQAGFLESPPTGFGRIERGPWCVAGRSPIVIPNLSDAANCPHIPRAAGSTVYAGALLQAQGKVNGLLSCYWKTPDHLSMDLLALLVVLAEQLGIVVENHRLRQRVEEVATTQERQRVAQELHDAVAQTLYGLTLFARAGRDALQQDDRAKLERSLDFVEANAREALKEMRLLLFQLRSSEALDGADVADALNRRFDEVERRLGVQANVEMDATLPECEKKSVEIYRIVVEALNNSLKHANASHVHVAIRSENGGVRVTVRDNGVGFDAAQEHAGMGLRSMQNRAETLKGRLAINSRPGEGTVVSLWLEDERGELKKGGPA